MTDDRTAQFKELVDLCKAHDWYYSFSDDHGAWVRGEKQAKELAAKAEALGRDGKRLYQAYRDIHFNPAGTFSFYYPEDES